MFSDRSVVEAVACGTKGVIDSFERAGVACDRLVFSGGIVNNSLWSKSPSMCWAVRSSSSSATT